MNGDFWVSLLVAASERVAVESLHSAFFYRSSKDSGKAAVRCIFGESEYEDSNFFY